MRTIVPIHQPTFSSCIRGLLLACLVVCTTSSSTMFAQTRGVVQRHGNSSASIQSAPIEQVTGSADIKQAQSLLAEKGSLTYNANGTLSFFTGSLGTLKSKAYGTFRTPFVKSPSTLKSVRASVLSASAQPVVQEALALLRSTKVLSGLQNPEQELSLITINQDELGYQHIRFEQVYQGLRIYGRDVILHANTSGDVYAVHGKYEATPLRAATKAFATPELAMRNVLADLQDRGEQVQMSTDMALQLGYEGDVIELMYLPQNGRLRLVYGVQTTPEIGKVWMYFVDALTGEVLDRTSLSRKDNSQYGKQPQSYVQANRAGASVDTNPAELLATLTASIRKISGTVTATTDSTEFRSLRAITLLGDTVRVRSWVRPSDGRVFPLSDIIFRPTDTDRLPSRPNGGHIVLDANGGARDGNVLTRFLADTTQTWSRNTATALFMTDSVLRYFATRHNVTSWDGNGSGMRTIINIAGLVPGNRTEDAQAWWDPSLRAQGYGPGALSEGGAGWRDLHLVGHEVGHAYNTPGRLDYGDAQSGALEEHYAQFWGWMVYRDTWYVFPRLWGATADSNAATHASGIPDSMGVGVRNRPIPHFRNFLTREQQQERGLQFPHTNEPILSRAGWLVASRFGRDVADRIWYRALTNYLVQNTQFGDFRRVLIQSAQDLYSSSGTISTTGTLIIAGINAAFDSVGIQATTTVPTRTRLAGGSVDDGSVIQQTGRSTITFSTQSGRIGIYDVANRRATYLTSTDAIVRTTGGRSQVTAVNNRIYFANRQGQVALYDIRSNRVVTFPNVRVRSTGDVLSVAVSPDERLLLITSQYDNDPNLYLATINTVTANPQSVPTGINAPVTIPLQRNVTAGAGPRPKAEGRTIGGIRYPEAIAWSPDTRTPEFVFDALSSIISGTDTTSFWGLYFGVVGRNSVGELYPPDPNYTLGYPTIGKTNANTIAMNEFYGDTTDVYIANFDLANDVGFLNLPNFTLNNRRVLDAQGASFSADDRQLVLASPSRPRDLLFYTFARGTTPAGLTAVTLDSTVFLPNWTTLDLTSSVQNNTRAKGVVISTTPHPVTAEARIMVEVERSGFGTLALYDMQGREVLRVAEQLFTAGTHSFPLSAATMPSGMYMVRLSYNGMMVSSPLVIAR